MESSFCRHSTLPEHIRQQLSGKTAIPDRPSQRVICVVHRKPSAVPPTSMAAVRHRVRRPVGIHDSDLLLSYEVVWGAAGGVGWALIGNLAALAAAPSLLYRSNGTRNTNNRNATNAASATIFSSERW
jgi:hypothetical protein